MLDNKLKRQVTLSAFQMVATILWIVGYILLFTSIGVTDHSTSSIHGSKRDKLSAVGILGIVFVTVFGITAFVLWILQIVFATQINSLTHDSAILIVFSVLTFVFANLIVAISQKNKFTGTSFDIPASSRPLINNNVDDNFETKLKRSFIDGVISSKEYEEKLKKYNESK